MRQSCGKFIKDLEISRNDRFLITVLKISMTDQGIQFPVQPKKKMSIVIQDHFDAREIERTDYILSQLDTTEKNEIDIVNAVSGNKDGVPTPEVTAVQNYNSESLKSGSVFSAPNRCYNYDSDFFEPLEFFADEDALKFIEKFNATHKFLQMTPHDLEIVFKAIEEFAKDLLPEPPTLEKTEYFLGSKAPPHIIVSAIFDYWQTRPKQSGSVIKNFEFPPDHYQLRQGTQKIWRNHAKPRRDLSDTDYLKKLFEKLNEINQKREKMVAIYKEQVEKQHKEEKIVRDAYRKLKLKKTDTSSPSLTLPPKTNKENDLSIPPAHSLLDSTIPDPPNAPSFLSWCLEQD